MNPNDENAERVARDVTMFVGDNPVMLSKLNAYLKDYRPRLMVVFTTD